MSPILDEPLTRSLNVDCSVLLAGVYEVGEEDECFGFDRCGVVDGFGAESA